MAHVMRYDVTTSSVLENLIVSDISKNCCASGVIGSKPFDVSLRSSCGYCGDVCVGR